MNLKKWLQKLGLLNLGIGFMLGGVAQASLTPDHESLYAVDFYSKPKVEIPESFESSQRKVVASNGEVPLNQGLESIRDVETNSSKSSPSN